MKNNFLKKSFTTFFQVLIVIIFWLILDVIYSRFIYNDNQYGCFNYQASFYDLKPNCYEKEKIVKSAKSYKVFTDKFGYRYSGKRKYTTNKNLLVFLGDSFTYGVGLNYEQTFVSKIENFKSNHEVFNLAIPSYSPTTHLYQLEKLIDNKLYPKKVILVIDLTDVSDEAGRWERENKNQRPNLIANNLGSDFLQKKENQKSKWKEFKYKNFKGTKQITSYFNNQLRSIKIKLKKKINKNFTELGITRMGDFTYIKFEDLEQQWWLPHGVKGGLKKIESNVKKISQLTKQIEAEFYIVIYPWAVTLEFGQNVFNWEQYGEKLCKLSNCTKLINLFPEFNNYKNNYKNWSTDLYFLHDTHWNENGHNIVAKKIIDEIFDY